MVTESDVMTTRHAHSLVSRRSLPLIQLVMVKDLRVVALHHLRGFVRRSIVDDNHLYIAYIAESLPFNPIKGLAQKGSIIKGWNDNGNERRLHLFTPDTDTEPYRRTSD